MRWKSFAWATSKKGRRATKSKRLRGEDRWGHHPKSGAARSPRRVRRGGLEAFVACMDRALQERHKSRVQAADAELKSRDGAKTISEKEASVSSEQELRLAARAVNMTAEDGSLQAELALREARQHRAWKERWPCHVDVAVYIVSLHIASYVAFFRTGIVYSSSSRYQVPGYFPAYVHTRSSPSPESESSALERRIRARALFTRFGDRRYAVTRRTSSRTLTLTLMSLGCIAFTGTYSRGIPGTYVYIGVYRCNIKSSSARIVF